MKLVSSEEMKKLDRLATKEFGIPSLILMENAGRSAADEAEKMLKNKTSKIIIFCGYGNNGGDGFAAARHLINRGYSVRVYLVGKQKKMTAETKTNFAILIKMKANIKIMSNPAKINAAAKYLRKAQLFIDAIFGIGIKGGLDNFYCELFEKLNNLGVATLSIDIPSGLDADSGLALPEAIRAQKTVTMGLAKKGFLNPAAKRYLGKVVVADISLPKQLRLH